jgi:ribosomal-protein-alanine N-acetyltransferase
MWLLIHNSLYKLSPMERPGRGKDYVKRMMYLFEMEEPTIIRTARRKDFNRLVELENICFPKEHAYNRRQIRYLLTEANSSVLVESQDSHIRGFIIILYRKGTMVAGIETINVDPAYRRAGIGNRLLKTAENIAKKKGIGTLRLEVAVTNHAAINLYEKAGFTKVKLLKDYYYFDHKGSRDGYRMIKYLD